MANITAAQVRALREKTDLPMMECKQALTECNGDEQAAVEWLRKKHKGKMAERAERETGEGRVVVFIDPSGTTGSIVDLRCETAPVAKNEQFIALGQEIAQLVAQQDEETPSPETVRAMAAASQPGKTVEDLITDAYGRIRENLQLVSCRKVSGAYLCSYVHHDGKKGVLIALDAKPSNDQVGIDLCHHVTFTQPLAITRDQIPAEKLEEVRKMAKDVAEAEGKPAQIIDKIVQGKVNRFCAENALMDQEHVKPEYEKKSVGAVLKGAGVTGVTAAALVTIGS
jgi:elongation factor Ts